MTPNEVSLIDHIKSMFDAHHREHVLIEQSLDKAAEAMNRRLETMNEFRAQLNEQKSDFATKEMLRPLVRFQDRFWGVILGLTILNALITGLVLMVLRKP